MARWWPWPADAMLFLLGLLQGLVGAFQYPRSIGPVPVAALLFAVAIGITCVLGAWGMGRPLGGLMPALGWFLAVFVLDMATAGGSVVIANIVPARGSCSAARPVGVRSTDRLPAAVAGAEDPAG